MDEKKVFEYRHYCVTQLTRLVREMTLCQCEGCKSVPANDRQAVLSQALVDVLATHVFLHCQNDKEAGDYLSAAHRKARETVSLCFTNFGKESVDEPKPAG